MIYKHDIQAVFGMQRYFRTFAASPSDSISDVVIQMHFLSLYKGRICIYSTRTKSGKTVIQIVIHGFWGSKKF